MKKSRFLAAVFAALLASAAFAADKKPSNVTVTYQEPDKFTDVRSDVGGGTEERYLDELSAHLQKTAGRYLKDGQKLEVTITDIDLAGDFFPTRADLSHVRIVKEIHIPKVALSFKLTDASGQVLKEGERRLSDMNFMNNIGLVDRNLPLFYDKALLTNWVEKEFKR